MLSSVNTMNFQATRKIHAQMLNFKIVIVRLLSNYEHIIKISCFRQLRVNSRIYKSNINQNQSIKNILFK